jgi:two-component system, NtrC family, sensor kinase
LISDTLKLVQHLRAQMDYQIDLSLQATLSISINQQELQQVLVNLIVNAIQALPEQRGELAIQSRDIDKHSVQISIRDNGHGMDEDQLGKVFNPFYTTKVQGQGTGLGLSISYSLIRHYGGNITVTSQPGKGTEFVVTLLCEPVIMEEESMIKQQLDEMELSAMEE